MNTNPLKERTLDRQFRWHRRGDPGDGIKTHSARAISPYSHAMKINYKQKTLTLGDFIAAVYAAHGKQKAKRIVRLAINAHLVEFRGYDRFVIS